MPYKITEDCMACGDCAVICPVAAIENGYIKNFTMDYGKSNYADIFFITDKCIECGKCVNVCPTGAIIEF